MPEEEATPEASHPKRISIARSTDLKRMKSCVKLYVPGFEAWTYMTLRELRHAAGVEAQVPSRVYRSFLKSSDYF